MDNPVILIVLAVLFCLLLLLLSLEDKMKRKNKNDRTGEIVFNLIVVVLGIIAILYAVAIYFTPFAGG